jgi:hypothetical protein
MPIFGHHTPERITELIDRQVLVIYYNTK